MRKIPPLLVACALVTLAWAALYAQRGFAHAPNVDDYLYTRLSHDLLAALATGARSFASAFLDTGQTAPLVPTLAMPGAGIAGVQGAVAVELFFLLLLAVAVYGIARVRLSQGPSAWIAAGACLNQAVLGWALMLNFALAVSALTACAFAAYLRSDHLRKWRCSLGTAVAVGLLSIARSLAPAYVLPLVVVMAADLTWHYRKSVRAAPWAQIVAFLVSTAVLAAPWWAVSGRTALGYLAGFGYSPSTGFAGSGGVLLAPSALVQRVGYTAADLGMVQAIAVGALGLAAVVMAVRYRRSDVVLIAVWVVAVMVILATSGNSGTGFGLPPTVLCIVLTGVLLTATVPRKSLAALVALLLAFGFAAEVFGSDSALLLGPPYRAEAEQADGVAKLPNVDSLHQAVLRAIGPQPTLLARDDDLLNAEGLVWFASREGVPVHLLVPDYGPSGTATAQRLLSAAHFLILGTTLGPYHQLSMSTLAGVAATRGFTLVRSWQVSAQASVDLWERR